jgi:hypothetical protein
MILLPLIVHTQRQYKSYAITSALDSLSEEKRLVVLGITRMEYLNADNKKLSQENQALTKINEINVSYIAQIERELTDIRQVNDRNIEAKKKWRRATLYSVGLNVTFLASLIVLSR